METALDSCRGVNGISALPKLRADPLGLGWGRLIAAGSSMNGYPGRPAPAALIKPAFPAAFRNIWHPGREDEITTAGNYSNPARKHQFKGHSKAPWRMETRTLGGFIGRVRPGAGLPAIAQAESAGYDVVASIQPDPRRPIQEETKPRSRANLVWTKPIRPGKGSRINPIKQPQAVINIPRSPKKASRQRGRSIQRTTPTAYFPGF